MITVWYSKMENEVIKANCDICEITHDRKITDKVMKKVTDRFDTIVQLEKTINKLETDDYIEYMVSDLVSITRELSGNSNTMDKNELRARLYLLEYPTEVLESLLQEAMEVVDKEYNELMVILSTPAKEDSDCFSISELQDKCDEVLYRKKS